MANLARGLGEQIVQKLRHEILSGRLAEGEVLQETALAERFGVSRGPVRDALLVLEMEGIVTQRRSRGAVVASPAPDSIHALISPIRHTLEQYALDLVFKRLDDRCFQVWDACLEQMRRACIVGDEPAIIEADIALHYSILELAEQPDLQAIWRTIVGRLRLHFLKDSRRYPDPMDHYAEHVTLVDAFRKRNLKLAMKALTEHIVK